MGILRTILAIAVVVYHSFTIFGLRMCGGQVAVESFYMISGFYMALILNEKYIGLNQYRNFISSRFYRIFPVYWIVLTIAVIISVIGYVFFNNPLYLNRYINQYECLNGFTIFYFIIENLIIFGQDVLCFLKLNDDCSPEFAYYALSFKHTGFQYLLVPQAWTISLELMFYVMAPFLVTKKIKWQIILVVLSLLLRFIYYRYLYLDVDPWTYRFFPMELAFFISGSVAYQCYKLFQKKDLSNKIGYTLLLLNLILIVFYSEIIIDETIKMWLFYSLVFISIPFIFLAFKNNSIDRYIGDLSFSIYISHHLIVAMFRNYFLSRAYLCPYYGYSVLVCSLILATILLYIVIRPFEKKRQARFLIAQK